MRAILSGISLIAGLFDIYHIIDIVTHYNILVVEGNMSTTQYVTDLTNSFLLLIPILFVFFFAAKGKE
jgi:hypothetical protein